MNYFGRFLLIMVLITNATSFSMFTTGRQLLRPRTTARQRLAIQQQTTPTTSAQIQQPTVAERVSSPTLAQRLMPTALYNWLYGEQPQTSMPYIEQTSAQKPGQPLIHKRSYRSSMAPKEEPKSWLSKLTSLINPQHETTAETLNTDLIKLMNQTKYWVSPRGIEFPNNKDFNTDNLLQAQKLIDEHKELINTLVQPGQSYEFYWDAKTHQEIEGISDQAVQASTTADLIVSDILNYMVGHKYSDELIAPDSIKNELKLLRYTEDAGGMLNPKRKTLYINGMQQLLNILHEIIKLKGGYKGEIKKTTLLEVFDDLYSSLLRNMPDFADQLKELKYQKDRMVNLSKNISSAKIPADEAKTILISKFNLSPDASFADINKAYWEYNAQHHPEAKNPNKDSYEEFGRINQAYGTIYKHEKEKMAKPSTTDTASE